MYSINELKKAITNGAPLKWNDPDPIEDNDYNITSVGDLSDFEDDMSILIRYNNGKSEAEVLLSEISYVPG